MFGPRQYPTPEQVQLGFAVATAALLLSMLMLVPRLHLPGYSRLFATFLALACLCVGVVALVSLYLSI